MPRGCACSSGGFSGAGEAPRWGQGASDRPRDEIPHLHVREIRRVVDVGGEGDPLAGIVGSRDGPHGDEGVEEWQVGIAQERSKERAEDLDGHLGEEVSEHPTHG